MSGRLLWLTLFLGVSRIALGDSANLSPYQVRTNAADVQVTLDYLGEPRITVGAQRALGITVRNLAPQPRKIQARFIQLPNGWRVLDLPTAPVSVAANAETLFQPMLLARETSEAANRLTLEISSGTATMTMLVTLYNRFTVGGGNLAMAARGATARADSELDKEPGCTPKAIDGIVTGETDFESNRWHAALTPHPHWIEIQLPKPALIGRVVLRCGDPIDYPVSFQGLVRPVGAQDLREIFSVTDNAERRAISVRFTPVVTDVFRLVIRSSANPQLPDAAQLSEIEIYPPGE